MNTAKCSVNVSYCCYNYSLTILTPGHLSFPFFTPRCTAFHSGPYQFSTGPILTGLSYRSPCLHVYSPTSYPPHKARKIFIIYLSNCVMQFLKILHDAPADPTFPPSVVVNSPLKKLPTLPRSQSALFLVVHLPRIHLLHLHFH